MGSVITSFILAHFQWGLTPCSGLRLSSLILVVSRLCVRLTLRGPRIELSVANSKRAKLDFLLEIFSLGGEHTVFITGVFHPHNHSQHLFPFPIYAHPKSSTPLFIGQPAYKNHAFIQKGSIKNEAYSGD